MRPETEFAIVVGLHMLHEDDMRKLLYDILTFETDGKIENVIEFSYVVRTSINNAILMRLREQEK
jgi:hypothetical protein